MKLIKGVFFKIIEDWITRGRVLVEIIKRMSKRMLHNNPRYLEIRFA